VLVLLDEQLPRPLGRELTGHVVRTVQQQGWAGISNGELLQRASDAGFDVLLTAYQNLQYQQNLSRYRIGVVVLAAPSTRLSDLLPLVPGILDALTRIHPGQVLRVSP
jgi:hypothetical protein